MMNFFNRITGWGAVVLIVLASIMVSVIAYLAEVMKETSFSLASLIWLAPIVFMAVIAYGGWKSRGGNAAEAKVLFYTAIVFFCITAMLMGVLGTELTQQLFTKGITEVQNTVRSTIVEPSTSTTPTESNASELTKLEVKSASSFSEAIEQVRGGITSFPDKHPWITLGLLVIAIIATVVWLLFMRPSPTKQRLWGILMILSSIFLILWGLSVGWGSVMASNLLKEITGSSTLYVGADVLVVALTVLGVIWLLQLGVWTIQESVIRNPGTHRPKRTNVVFALGIFVAIALVLANYLPSLVEQKITAEAKIQEYPTGCITTTGGSVVLPGGKGDPVCIGFRADSEPTHISMKRRWGYTGVGMEMHPVQTSPQPVLADPIRYLKPYQQYDRRGANTGVLVEASPEHWKENGLDPETWIFVDFCSTTDKD